MKKKLPKFFDRVKVMHNKDYASAFRQQPYQKFLYDYTVNNMCDHLSYVRKDFHNAAFIGYNPETFVQNLPSSNFNEKFFAKSSRCQIGELDVV